MWHFNLKASTWDDDRIRKPVKQSQETMSESGKSGNL